jgi:hypothetical protein
LLRQYQTQIQRQLSHQQHQLQLAQYLAQFQDLVPVGHVQVTIHLLRRSDHRALVTILFHPVVPGRVQAAA